jgi:hypothetical protein
MQKAVLSPNSISVITSFFVVRELKGTFTFNFANPSDQTTRLPLPAENEIRSESETTTLLSQETISRLQSGNYHQNSSHKTDKISIAAGRQLEYLHCLLMNLHCPIVKNIFLLIEDAPSADLLYEVMVSLDQFSSQRHKLIPIMFNKKERKSDSAQKFANLNQPLYADFFEVATQFLHPTNDIAAICNSDIHFHTTHNLENANLKKWLFSLNNENNKETVLALTRYEEDVSSFNRIETTNNDSQNIKTFSSNGIVVPREVKNCPLIDDYRGSHDAFLFRTKSIINDLPSFLDSVSHPQNAYQSENVVIDAFSRTKDVELRNPCLASDGVRIAHKHESDVRQWYPSLGDGRYGKVVPE